MTDDTLPVRLMTFFLLPISVLFIAWARFKFDLQRRSKGQPPPPSRKGWPLLGNALDLLCISGCEWEAFQRWGEELGSKIVYINAAGTNIVVLNSKEIVVELLDQKSLIFSCRPQVNIIHLMGWDWVLPFLPYGDAWRIRRRLFHHHFPPGRHEVHGPRSVSFLHRMLLNMMDTPDDVQAHTKEFIYGLMFSLAYGIDLTKETHWFDMCEAAIRPLVHASVPGRFWIDFFPALKYIPAWVPGAGFQKKAAAWRVLQEKFRYSPFKETLRRMEDGRVPTSFVSLAMEDESYFEKGIASEEHKTAIMDAASMFYAAGSETTAATLDFLILALALHPKVQKRAQHELDALLRNDNSEDGSEAQIRLPSLEDATELPYISALIKECLRWQPAAPIGVPHLSTEDYVHRGYFIPKGSIVIGNSWAMLRDERVYEDPHLFRPERFLHSDGSLNENVPDPHEISFGFGRRTCPGQHIASSSLFIAPASVLLLFDVGKPKYEDGRIVDVDTMHSTPGLARGPGPVKCKLKPRDGVTRTLVRDLW